MVKSYSQKLRVLYVMQVLLRYSDEEHPISQAEISERLNAYGIQADRKSIYDDIKVLNEFGLEIENRRAKPSGFYVSERSFELPELKLLVDAVQSSKFITAKKSNELIRKLEELASVHEAKTLQRQVFVGNRIKTMNESIYYNVDKIHSAINADSGIKFQYYQWNVKREMVLRHDGAWYNVSPWALVWDNENYYMIGYDTVVQQIRHYRVDKMLWISATDKRREGKHLFKSLDIAAYSRKMFGMFGGEEVRVALEAKDHTAGILIDRFGQDIRIIPGNNGMFTAYVDVTVSPQFLGWVFSLGTDIRIAGPKSVVEMMRMESRRLAEQYL